MLDELLCKEASKEVVFVKYLDYQFVEKRLPLVSSRSVIATCGSTTVTALSDQSKGHCF